MGKIKTFFFYVWLSGIWARSGTVVAAESGAVMCPHQPSQDTVSGPSSLPVLLQTLATLHPSLLQGGRGLGQGRGGLGLCEEDT